MPTYEYLCSNCKHEWEEVQKISEPALQVCPKCSKKTAHRQISGGNFILKGGGWYSDLYSSPKPTAKSSEGSSESKSESKKDDAAKPSESKTAKDSSTSPKAESTPPKASPGGDTKS